MARLEQLRILNLQDRIDRADVVVEQLAEVTNRLQIASFALEQGREPARVLSEQLLDRFDETIGNVEKLVEEAREIQEKSLVARDFRVVS